MAKNRNKNRIFRFNRRIRGITNYQLRLKLLKSNLPRAVIRRSNNNMLVQITSFDDKGDKVHVSAKSTELKKLGSTIHTGNIVSAYLTGYLAGKKVQKAKLNTDVIVDFGLQEVIPGNRLYAAAKGIKDSGVNIRISSNVFPSEQRLNGEHLKSKDVTKIIGKVKESIEGL